MLSFSSYLLVETPEMAKVTDCAKAILQLAEQWKLVEKEDESEDEP